VNRLVGSNPATSLLQHPLAEGTSEGNRKWLIPRARSPRAFQISGCLPHPSYITRGKSRRVCTEIKTHLSRPPTEGEASRLERKGKAYETQQSRGATKTQSNPDREAQRGMYVYVWVCMPRAPRAPAVSLVQEIWAEPHNYCSSGSSPLPPFRSPAFGQRTFAKQLLPDGVRASGFL